MPRPLVGEEPMTGAERQARPMQHFFARRTLSGIGLAL